MDRIKMYEEFMKKTILVFSLLAIFSNIATAQNIYKYIDKNGAVVYVDKMLISISQEVDVYKKGSASLKKVIQKDEQLENASEEVVEDENVKRKRLEQNKKDQRLILLYQKVEDIDNARNNEVKDIKRNIENDRLALATLEEKKEVVESTLAKNPKNKDNLNKELGLIIENINSITNNIVKNEDSLNKINLRYMEDKERFLEIKASATNVKK